MLTEIKTKRRFNWHTHCRNQLKHKLNQKIMKNPIFTSVQITDTLKCFIHLVSSVCARMCRQLTMVVESLPTKQNKKRERLT